MSHNSNIFCLATWLDCKDILKQVALKHIFYRLTDYQDFVEDQIAERLLEQIEEEKQYKEDAPQSGTPCVSEDLICNKFTNPFPALPGQVHWV